MTKEVREYFSKLIDYALSLELESGLCQCDGCSKDSEDGHDGLYSGQDIEVFSVGNHRAWVFRKDINYVKDEK
tara:strand:- start:337 stop:555 length:219 start_codon:yes stop_codon:yes gene_type:complete